MQSPVCPDPLNQNLHVNKIPRGGICTLKFGKDHIDHITHKWGSDMFNNTGRLGDAGISKCSSLSLPFSSSKSFKRLGCEHPSKLLSATWPKEKRAVPSGPRKEQGHPRIINCNQPRDISGATVPMTQMSCDSEILAVLSSPKISLKYSLALSSSTLISWDMF